MNQIIVNNRKHRSNEESKIQSMKFVQSKMSKMPITLRYQFEHEKI